MRVRKASLVGLVAVAAAVTFGVGAPQASADLSDCPAQWLCLWDGGTYGTDIHRWHDNGWQNVEPAFNDLASSYYNNTNRYATIAQHVNGGGNKWCIGPGSYNSLVGSFMNTVTSSVYLSPSGCG